MDLLFDIVYDNDDLLLVCSQLTKLKIVLGSLLCLSFTGSHSGKFTYDNIDK